MDRRDFLKFAALSLLVSPFRKLIAGPMEHAESINIWEGNFFKQKTVDSSRVREGIIKAMVDSKWETYRVRKLPDAFMDWNLSKRLEDLDGIMKGEMPGFAGPHSGIISSYGVGRKDSKFTLNNAVKGFGFTPRREHINEKIEYMKDTFDESPHKKIGFLKELYQKPELLNPYIQTSLELYSTPDFETHSFLNLMKNPQATVVFLDIPSYELRTIVRVIHPDDKRVESYERKIVEYTNLIHSYFHGKFKKDFIGLICYVIEVYDNSPAGAGGENNMGRRMV